MKQSLENSVIELVGAISKLEAAAGALRADSGRRELEIEELKGEIARLNSDAFKMGEKIELARAKLAELKAEVA
ncbi:MAG: hypothetical protein FWD15_01010 [Alphaproteobacteria bacterium]|nr:hypothetical protein [Alphaproteobacteria bacterium]